MTPNILIKYEDGKYKVVCTVRNRHYGSYTLQSVAKYRAYQVNNSQQPLNPNRKYQWIGERGKRNRRVQFVRKVGRFV